MKDLFVPYEVALRMKELGFDKPSLAYYDGWNGQSHLIITNQSSSFLSRIFRVFRKTEPQTYNQDYVEYINGICTAPTFSQCFKFFREKYRLSVLIHDCLDDYIGEIVEWTLTEDKIIHEVPNRIKTYEETELACINKLIEIVKKIV